MPALLKKSIRIKGRGVSRSSSEKKEKTAVKAAAVKEEIVKLDRKKLFDAWNKF